MRAIPLILATAMVLTGCGSEHGGGDPVAAAGANVEGEDGAAVEEEPEAVLDIVDVIGGNPDLATLSKAIEAAGLKAQLSGEGPFTLLAPNNVSFDKLGADNLAKLLEPENKARLTSILTYHVIPGKLDIAALRKMIEDADGTAIIKTLQGETFTATIELDQVRLTDANGKAAGMAVTDVAATNGIVHVLDTVIEPAQ